MPTRKPVQPASRTKPNASKTARSATKATGKRSGATGKSRGASSGTTSARSTTSGPSHSDATVHAAATDALAAKMEGTQTLAAEMPFNPNKPLEYGKAASSPQAGAAVEPDDPAITASTLTETTASRKTGDGEPPAGINPTNGPLDRVRVDSGGQALTTNQGVPIATNQDSLKVGLRGPALLEDFILREKLTHFDHERIPERVVHARGSAAHGFFECHESLADLTRASIFAEAGKRTPVFVRFSTVIGERGSKDTARDVRGFAVKFYTDEGNWDLVGNNMPVFFIQDAMKFPDLIHAAKPQPHFQMPQAATAHDTFWDFISLMPESAHMIMWAMSDRAIPRSYRMMQGFGVHTFRFVNAAGESRFVKFHWNPVEGTHSLVWDEAVKIAGADPDFHRRDLWEAIEAGQVPRVGARSTGLHRGRGRSLQLRRARLTKFVPEESCRFGRSAGWCSTAIRTTSLPRPSRSRSARRTSCRASTSATTRCLPGASTRTWTRRSRGSAAELSGRASDQRAGRSGAQQPAPTAWHARPSIAGAWPTSRTRWGAVARSRPARRDSLRSRSRSTRTRCVAGRRNLPTTTRRRSCSSAAKRPSSRRTSSPRCASS